MLPATSTRRGSEGVVLDALDVLLQPGVVLLAEVLHSSGMSPAAPQRGSWMGTTFRRSTGLHGNRPAAISFVRSREVADQAHYHARRLHAPTRSNSLSWMARRSFTCISIGSPDLVEEQRPAVGQLEAAGLALHGPGERPLFEPEQLGLDELARDAAQLILITAGRGGWIFVQRGCDQLLAGPLSPWISTVEARPHLGNDLLQLDHPLALADDLGEPPPRLVGDHVPGVRSDWRAALAMIVFSSECSNGLVTKSSAGLHRLDGAVHAAVRLTTITVRPVEATTLRSSESPSILGITRSVTTTSAPSRSSAANASSPSDATCTS